MKNILNTFKNLVNYFRENYKMFLVFIGVLILVVASLQFYFSYSKNQILKSSILYNEAKTDFDSNIFEQNMKNLSNENNFYGILASIDLIKYNINKKNYDEAYILYLELLQSKKLNNLYKSLIALHGSYNLFDYIETNKISKLISFVNKDYTSFQSNYYEIEYLLSLKENNINEANIIFESIIDNENISSQVKDRINKLHEFQKYK